MVSVMGKNSCNLDEIRKSLNELGMSEVNTLIKEVESTVLKMEDMLINKGLTKKVARKRTSDFLFGLTNCL